MQRSRFLTLLALFTIVTSAGSTLLLAGAAVSTLICLLSLWLIGWLMSARVNAAFSVYR